MVFGLNSSMDFNGSTQVGIYTSYRTATFVNYLDPNATYYYKVSAIAVCTDSAGKHDYSGTASGSWTDAASRAIAITGTITNTTGVAAPVGTDLTLQCYSSLHYDIASTYGWTTGAGNYSLAIFNWNPNECTGGLQLNIFTTDNKNGAGSNWLGNMNATYMVYMYGDYNIVLPQDFVSPWYPIGVGPSNVNQTGGAAGSVVSYTQGTTLTTQSSTCWDLFWVYTGCTVSSTSWAASKTFQADNESLDVDQRFWTTGTMAFVAMTRASNITCDRYATYLNPLSPGPYPNIDFMTPQNFTKDNMYYLTGWGTSDQGQFVQYKNPIGGSITTSTVSTSMGVQAIDFDIGIDVYGVDLGTTAASVSWSQTATETQSNTLGWTAYAPTSAGECFVVYGEGGSASTNTADAIGIWAYAPNGGPAGSNCPDP
jgi:hypothetical protein